MPVPLKHRAWKLFDEVWRRRRFRPYVSDTTTSGYTYQFFIGDPVGERWYPRDRGDQPEFEFLRDEVVRPGDVVFECGGHHGLTALFLSDLVGDDGLVVTFEPFSDNVDILCRNVVLNRRSNIVCEHAIVGARCGSTRIYKKSNAKVVPGKLTSAAVTTIDDYVNRSGVTPTVLKIDVEGFEMEVLRGARETLESKPKIALEIHTPVLGRYHTTVEEVLGALELDSYELWLQRDDRERPERWDRRQPITDRVHLFAMPKR